LSLRSIDIDYFSAARTRSFCKNLGVWDVLLSWLMHVHLDVFVAQLRLYLDYMDDAGLYDTGRLFGCFY